MRVAAMRIPSGYLPYIFGKNHAQVTLNFGGKNIYRFESDGSVVSEKNDFFLDDIFDGNISLVSCIVGGNGGGKTTLLRLLVYDANCGFIIENSDGTYEEITDLEKFHRIYCTPYLHHSILANVGNNGKELSKVALLKMDNHGDGGQLDDFLAVHHSENSKRWIKFNNFYRKNQLSKSSIPIFKRVELSLNHFENNVVMPDSFHQTSYQFRPIIVSLFKKIEVERKEVEVEHFLSKGDDQNLKDKSHFLVRFEYALYETVIGKFVSILESRGNRYLNEGYLAEDYEDQISQRDVRSAVEWFLHNSGVYQGENRYNFSQNLEILNLIDYVRSLIIPENLTDNWLIINISEEEALRVIELSDALMNSFVNEWFTYDKKPMFGYLPLIFISSGEQQFLNLFSVLYNHAENIKNGVSIDLHSFNSLEYIEKDILLLLDESDNAFHPQWKKEYIKNLRSIIPAIFEGFNIQIIITSHDPLTLSDFPKNNVVFLEKGAAGTIVGDSQYKHTFGANISDLLKDSFFLNDGQIGAFVADKIDQTISEIHKGDISAENRQRLERIITALDEPIIKFKLAEMLSESLGDSQFEKELLDNEITRLQEKRKFI